MCVYMAKGISLAIVVAVADNGVIGAEGGLPWNISRLRSSCEYVVVEVFLGIRRG